eukprot:7391847-Prymnesium_polylepis.10
MGATEAAKVEKEQGIQAWVYYRATLFGLPLRTLRGSRTVLAQRASRLGGGDHVVQRRPLAQGNGAHIRGAKSG